MSRFALVRAFPAAGFLFRPKPISDLYETLAFIYRHRRLPDFERTGYLNDLMHTMKVCQSEFVARSFTTDKELAKIFVRGVTGEDLCVPTLDVIRDVDHIDSYRFPGNCVVKPTHLSGEVIFLRGDATREERRRMRRWMKLNFADMTGEANYSRLDPKIIIEPWLKLNGAFSHDYECHVDRGRVVAIDLGMGENGEDGRWASFSRDWERLPVRSLDAEDLVEASTGEMAQSGMDRPAQLSRMIEIAETIGRDFCHVRVDFYTDRKDVLYVGEITHVDNGARERLQPIEAERFYIRQGQARCRGTRDKSAGDIDV